jgi:hypothetical protein
MFTDKCQYSSVVMNWIGFFPRQCSARSQPEFRRWHLERYSPTLQPSGYLLRTTEKARANVAHSIFVVDDDTHIRDVIRFAFAKTGMKISTAQDGRWRP